MSVFLSDTAKIEVTFVYYKKQNVLTSKLALCNNQNAWATNGVHYIAFVQAIMYYVIVVTWAQGICLICMPKT